MKYISRPHYLKGKARNTHFQSKEDYRKYTAYLHIHNIPHHKTSMVYIAGHKHRVKCDMCKS